MQKSRASENNFGASILRNICSFVALYFFSLLVPFYSIAIVLPTIVNALRGDIYTFFSKERQLSQK